VDGEGSGAATAVAMVHQEGVHEAGLEDAAVGLHHIERHQSLPPSGERRLKRATRHD
jgi:hypothetical protein